MFLKVGQCFNWDGKTLHSKQNAVQSFSRLSLLCRSFIITSAHFQGLAGYLATANMMSNTVGRLALFATLPLLTSGFTVTQDNDGSGQTVAQAIFTGQGLSVVNWDLSAASGSYGSFADGPFGIGSGGILATGPVSGALPGGNRNVDNGHSNNGEQDSYCGPNSQNALVLYAGVFIDSGYNGVQLEFILATEEDEGYVTALEGNSLSLTQNN